MVDYERTLTLRAPLTRVWRAFTEPEELRAWHGNAKLFEPRPGGRVLFDDEGWPPVPGRVVEVEPQRLLRWVCDDDDCEITEWFSAAADGTSVTVRQVSQPTPPEHERQSYQLGWDESLADLALLVEHGVAESRHMSPRVDLGARTRQVTAGVQMVEVAPGSWAASVDLRPGDLLIRLGPAPVFSRSDLALIARSHPPGTRLEVEYARAGERHRATAIVPVR